MVLGFIEFGVYKGPGIAECCAFVVVVGSLWFFLAAGAGHLRCGCEGTLFLFCCVRGGGGGRVQFSSLYTTI